MNLKTEYRRFNRTYFGNSLPKDAIVEFSSEGLGTMIARAHVHGFTRCSAMGCDCSFIRISPELEKYRSLSLMTLLHEMAHLKVTRKHPRSDSHGTLWQREMKRLARIGAFNGLW